MNRMEHEKSAWTQDLLDVDEYTHTDTQLHTTNTRTHTLTHKDILTNISASNSS